MKTHAIYCKHKVNRWSNIEGHRSCIPDPMHHPYSCSIEASKPRVVITTNSQPKLVKPIIFQHFRFNRWMEGRGGWQKLNSIGVGGLHCNGNRANIGQSGHILY